MKIPEKINIEELLVAISEDNLRAFSVFYDLYFQKIYDFSKYYLRSDEMCREAVSDVFFYLWKNRKQLPLVRNIESYLFVSVKNQALKQKKVPLKNVLENFEQVPPDLMVDIHTPEETVINEEMTRIIKKAIDELPERCKIIFLMVREENLKYKEVAEILSISDRTVHAQMIIAVKKIVNAIRLYFPSINEGKALILFIHFFKQS